MFALTVTAATRKVTSATKATKLDSSTILQSKKCPVCGPLGIYLQQDCPRCAGSGETFNAVRGHAFLPYLPGEIVCDRCGQKEEHGIHELSQSFLF